ncbi:MAG: FtsQ-type POTRA domain-containing protein [Candidatus Binatota bacterium]
MAVQNRRELAGMEIFVHRKGNKKKAGEYIRPRLVIWTVVLVMFSSTLALYQGWSYVERMGLYLRDSFLGHSYFAVQEIKVKGGEKVGGSEIVAMAGMSQGMNIWKIDPEIIERKVAKHPWVKRVLVRRELPRRVVIEVEEREAKGIVVLGRLYYVDPEGFVFKEVEEGENTDFPLLTGLKQADLLSQAHATRQKIREALKLSDLMARGPLSISEIHFPAQGGVVLYPMAYPVALRMGWGDWQEKLKRLESVLEHWKGREARLASVDLRFRDQVVARLKKGF